MESIEIDIKNVDEMGEREEKNRSREVLEKKKRSRPKVTHVPPLMGGVCLNNVSPWGGSQLSSRDQHQHIMSNTVREG